MAVEEMFSEKSPHLDSKADVGTDSEHAAEGDWEDHEVFKKTEGGVDFRTVGWFKACVIFVKVMFAVGVLSLPSSMHSLGAIRGSLSIIAWGLFNTYTFLILGEFRMEHPGCHSIADMADVVGGVVIKEITGVLFVFAYVLCRRRHHRCFYRSQRPLSSCGLYSLVGTDLDDCHCTGCLSSKAATCELAHICRFHLHLRCGPDRCHWCHAAQSTRRRTPRG